MFFPFLIACFKTKKERGGGDIRSFPGSQLLAIALFLRKKTLDVPCPDFLASIVIIERLDDIVDGLLSP